MIEGGVILEVGEKTVDDWLVQEITCHEEDALPLGDAEQFSRIAVISAEPEDEIGHRHVCQPHTGAFACSK